MGGLGIWWPERCETVSPLSIKEAQYLEYEWKYQGCMQWAAFNELRNSSTRCELGGARMAMQRDGPVHIGIDNQATVTAVNEIAEHQIRRKNTKLVNEKGGLIIGGETTRYHSISRSKRPWSLVKNGDLQQSIEEGVIQKGEGSLKASKVKGHATEEMVEEGKVRRKDKEGNDISDEGADRGAGKPISKLQLLDMYSVKGISSIKYLCKEYSGSSSR